MFIKVQCRTVDLPCYDCLTVNCIGLEVCSCTCHGKCGCSHCKHRLRRNKQFVSRLNRKDSVLSTWSTNPSTSAGTAAEASKGLRVGEVFIRVKRYTTVLSAFLFSKSAGV